MRRPVIAAGLAVLAACGPQKVVVDPAIAARATLAQADANLRVGCFDCLVEALEQYESVRAVAAVSGPAAAGATRASALLALRERELGTTDNGYLEHARQLLGAVPELDSEISPLLEIIRAFPWRAGAGRNSGSVDSIVTNLFANRDQKTATLRAAATRDEFAAYMFITYACESGTGLQIGNAEMRTAVGAMFDAPVVAYRLSICPTSGLARSTTCSSGNRVTKKGRSTTGFAQPARRSWTKRTRPIARRTRGGRRGPRRRWRSPTSP